MAVVSAMTVIGSSIVVIGISKTEYASGSAMLRYFSFYDQHVVVIGTAPLNLCIDLSVFDRQDRRGYDRCFSASSGKRQFDGVFSVIHVQLDRFHSGGCGVFGINGNLRVVGGVSGIRILRKIAFPQTHRFFNRIIIRKRPCQSIFRQGRGIK